jgi:hypothetical protein
LGTGFTPVLVVVPFSATPGFDATKGNAREFGIPAVASIPGILGSFETGNGSK